MSEKTEDERIETQLHLEKDGIAILSINNVRRRNAFSAAVKADMLRHLNGLMADAACKAIVITGVGGMFCSGGDVKSMSENGDDNNNYLSRRFQRGESSSGVMGMLVSGPKPVVTAVEGVAFGVGFGLAVASDLTVAAKDARFCAAQIRRGLCPDGLMYYTVTARCGPGRARELLLSGREFNALEGERYGVVHELTEPGAALEGAIAAAKRFASLPPIAFSLAKSAMTHDYHTLDQAYRAEQDYQPIVQLSNDHRESVKAFVEKRKPMYFGN